MQDRPNVFRNLLKKVNFGDRKVQVGIGVAAVLLVITIVLGNRMSRPEPDIDGNYDDTVTEEALIEVVDEPNYPDPETFADDDAEAVEPEPEPIEEAAAPAPEAAPVQEPVQTPLVTDEQINRDIDRATDVSHSDKRVYSINDVDVKPEFPGGMEALSRYISSNIQYPARAVEDGVQGRVIVQFTISRTGKIENVSIVRGRHPALDKEAIRVVKSMPDWKPGRKDGRTLNVQYSLPVTFQLS